jgi:hypothetical protein
MLALNRYLADSIAWTVSSSSIFRVISSAGAQKMLLGLLICLLISVPVLLGEALRPPRRFYPRWRSAFLAFAARSRSWFAAIRSMNPCPSSRQPVGVLAMKIATIALAAGIAASPAYATQMCVTNPTDHQIGCFDVPRVREPIESPPTPLVFEPLPPPALPTHCTSYTFPGGVSTDCY